MLFYVALFIWAACATIISKTTNPDLSFIFWKVACIGVTFTAVFSSQTIYLLIKQENRKIVVCTYVLAFFFTILISSTTLVLKKPLNNFYKDFWVSSVGNLYFVWFLYWLITILYAHFNFIMTFIKKRLEKPADLKLLLLAFSPGFICGILNFLNPFNFTIFQIANFGIALYVIVFTYLIFRNQLMGIEIIYRRSLLYSFLITILTGIYLLLIMIMEWLFRGILGYKSLIVSLSSAFIIAIVFDPLRNKIQILVDRLFLGKTPPEMAKENELLKHELEQSERLKTASALALGLAHEIKNPITTIKTFAEYLPDKLDDKEFLTKFAKLIPVETERINNIIRQLLKFSKPSPPKFQEVRIHQLIQDILVFLNNEFLKRKIRLSEAYENRETTILADSEQIKQVLLNIIFNSMEAMPDGGTISIETKNDNDSLELSISDTGCGITKEDLGHIFDPFYSKKESGTGLGLAITHQIIKNHNGKIEVQSELNKGTKFQIMFLVHKK